MTTPVYDTIGTGYNTTRAADPYLTSRILVHLAPHAGGRYLDVGCGTGNYLTALTRHGLQCIGVDPSATMVAAARGKCQDAPILRATAEQLPLRGAVFDGALAMLTTHHWPDVAAGYAEVARTLQPGARFVIFTFTPAQLRTYWLREYFPGMIERAAAGVPDLSDVTAMLRRTGFAVVATEPYLVLDDLQDHFLYSHKYRPERYLRPEVRAGASGFRLLTTPEEVRHGVARLEADVASGRIDRVIADAVRDAGDLGDYLFVIAEGVSRTPG